MQLIDSVIISDMCDMLSLGFFMFIDFMVLVRVCYQFESKQIIMKTKTQLQTARVSIEHREKIKNYSIIKVGVVISSDLQRGPAHG